MIRIPIMFRIIFLAGLFAAAPGFGQTPGAGTVKTEPAKPAAGDESNQPAEKDAAQEDEPPVDMGVIAKAVKQSMLRVEYFVKYDDKGNEPRSVGAGYARNLTDYVQEERPLETSGFLLNATELVTPDINIPPRFIDKIRVAYGEITVDATISGYCIEQDAVILTLASPLKGAVPLSFNTKAEKPYFTVSYSETDTNWLVNVKEFGLQYHLKENDAAFRSGPAECLITDRNGVPVGVTMIQEYPDNDSWKGDPLKWNTLSAAELTDKLKKIEVVSDAALVRVKLTFRSAKQKFGNSSNQTELNVYGIIMDSDKLLVLANMEPKLTARLETITAHRRKGGSISATFDKTFKDYGCFLATLSEPVTTHITLSRKNVKDYLNRLLPITQMDIKGEQIETHYGYRRFYGFFFGWKRNVFPSIPGQDSNVFIFDDNGALLAFPLTKRAKPGENSSNDYFSSVSLITAVFDHPEGCFDKANIPRAEEKENRLAWLGVELQEMNNELARFNNVSDRTSNGRSGALVTYVYPGSPADKAGIKIGDILLRLKFEDHPQPVDLTLTRNDDLNFIFPWDRLDIFPDDIFDRNPTPWKSRENTLTRLLSDTGIGKKFELEVFKNGKVVSMNFTIEEGPLTYMAAARYESKELGVTVRDLTYEVRRYFQLDKNDPGVILSKVKPGGKANVAGINRYEIITEVNGKPVRNVEDFKNAIAGQSELNLAVKRMTRGRMVNIKLN